MNYIVKATNFSRYSALTQSLTPSLYLLFKWNHFWKEKKIACHQKGRDPPSKFKLFAQDENSFPVLKWLQFAFCIFCSLLFFILMEYVSLKQKIHHPGWRINLRFLTKAVVHQNLCSCSHSFGWKVATF